MEAVGNDERCSTVCSMRVSAPPTGTQSGYNQLLFVIAVSTTLSSPPHVTIAQCLHCFSAMRSQTDTHTHTNIRTHIVSPSNDLSTICSPALNVHTRAHTHTHSNFCKHKHTSHSTANMQIMFSEPRQRTTRTAHPHPALPPTNCPPSSAKRHTMLETDGFARCGWSKNRTNGGSIGEKNAVGRK